MACLPASYGRKAQEHRQDSKPAEGHSGRLTPTLFLMRVGRSIQTSHVRHWEAPASAGVFYMSPVTPPLEAYTLCMAKAKTKRKKTALTGQKRGNVVSDDTVRRRGPVKPFTGVDDPRRHPGVPFANGYDPRRATQHPYGQTFAWWVSELDRVTADGAAAYDVPTLRQIAKDPTVQPSKRKAAKAHLRGEKDGFSKAGKPLAGDDNDRMCDRTVGKPLQAIVKVDARRPTGDIIAELRALFQAFPELHAELAPAAVPALPPVDGEAIVRGAPENGGEQPVHPGIDQSPCSGESG